MIFLAVIGWIFAVLLAGVFSFGIFGAMKLGCSSGREWLLYWLAIAVVWSFVVWATPFSVNVTA